MEFEDFVADGDGMTGVVAAAIAAPPRPRRGPALSVMWPLPSSPHCADDNVQRHRPSRTKKNPQMLQITQIEKHAHVCVMRVEPVALCSLISNVDDGADGAQLNNQARVRAC